MIKQQFLTMTGGVEGTSERFKVSHVVPPGMPPPSRDVMRDMLRHLSFKPQLHLYELGMHYSIAEEDRPDSGSFPRNTLAEVALPYCLHVPQHFAIEAKIENSPSSAVLLFTKIWTAAADGSADIDLFSDDRITYLAPIKVQTPNYPERKQFGPEPKFSGANLERERDSQGYFRYSYLQIVFDTNYGDLTKAESTAVECAKQECVALTLTLVNRIIDVYRVTTREDHVQRLEAVHIPNLYFADCNLGMYGASLGHGLRNAVMNRTRPEFEEIARLLSSGEPLDISDLLFLDSAAALQSDQLALTVVHAFQALELFLEGFLTRRLATLGHNPEDIAERLNRCWRTKDRLRDLLRDATGNSLNEHAALWGRFCTVYDQTRNRLIHAAAEINKPRAAECLQVCRDVIGWIKSL